MEEDFLESLPGLISHTTWDYKSCRKRVRKRGKWVTQWEYKENDTGNAKRMCKDAFPYLFKDSKGGKLNGTDQVPQV